MPRGKIVDQYEAWKRRKIREEEKRVEERVMLLPDDLAEQILEAGQKERQAIQDRIEILDASEARLDAMIEEVAVAKLEATRRTDPERIVTRRNAQGELVEVQRGSDARRISTAASCEAGRKLRALRLQKRAHQSERRHRLRQLAEIGRVERQARNGTVAAVLAITQTWTNKVALGGLAPTIRMAGHRWSDAAGVPLDPEALDENGEPASFPTAREVRAEASGPLVVEG